jgi:DNA-binding transcriptional ArsR family regulator
MSTTEQNTLAQDTVYDLLSNGRRRFVISRLRRAEEPLSVSDLSEAVAAWENDIPQSELTDKQIKRVYVSLYQIHIPKLDEAGLVAYDKDSGMVELTPAVSELDSYLPNQEPESEPYPWLLVYGGLAFLGLALYGSVLLFPETFGWLSMTMLNVVLFSLLVITTTTHYMIERWQ